MIAPLVVGLDLSLTSTGIAHVDGRVNCIKARGVGPARIEEIRATVMFGVDVDAELVVIEGYSHGSHLAYAREMGELGGVVRNALWRARIPYLDVAPNTLKKAATGNGRASKYDVIKAAERKLGYDDTSDDEADALWLQAIGRELLGFSPCEWTKAQAEAIEPLRHTTPNLAPREVRP